MRVRYVTGCLLTAAACLLIAVTSVSCDGDETVDPPPPPTLSEQLDDVLRDSLRAHSGTGVSAALRLPNSTAWVGVSGVSHGSVSITPQMLFGASSITKTYVAALTLALAEEGPVTLQDSLHEWIESFAHVDSSITIRQLLNHTSGVYDFVQFPDAWATILYDPSRVWKADEILSSFLTEPYSAPGAELHHSNSGYLLIGMVIQAATATEVSRALRSRIWEPLGLGSTFFEFEETIVGEIAHPWIDTGGTSLMDSSSVPRTAAYSASWTSGAVFTPAEELAEWGQALFGGEVLSEASLRDMLADPGSGSGLGTDLLLDEQLASGESVVGMAGSGIGYSGVLG